MAGRGVEDVRGQDRHPPFEAERELAGGEHAQPRGGQLDGQRQPVQADADLGQGASGGRAERAPRPEPARAGAGPQGCPAAGPGRRPRRPPASAGAVRRTHARSRAGAAHGWWRAPAAAARRPGPRPAPRRARPGARSCRGPRGAAGRPPRRAGATELTARTLSARPISPTTAAGSVTGASSTHATSWSSSTTASASRVLPTPGGPVSVTSRDEPSSARTSASSEDRPTSRLGATGTELVPSTG